MQLLALLLSSQRSSYPSLWLFFSQMLVKEIAVIVVGLGALNRKGRRSSNHQAFALKC